MRLSSRKLVNRSKVELSMTSMIDVVFLLLIFFMTTASFVKTERNLDPAITVRSKSVRQSPQDLEPAIVDVIASADRFVYKVGGRELVDQGELTNLLRRFENKSNGAFVRVSNEVPFRMAASAIQACKDAGFIAVSYVAADAAE